MYTKPWLIIAARLLPIISIGFILLSIFKKMSFQVSILILLIQTILFIFKFAERSKNLNLVYKHENSIKVYSKMLYQIERKSFKSEYLLELKDKLIDDTKLTACEQIKELEDITENIHESK